MVSGVEHPACAVVLSDTSLAEQTEYRLDATADISSEQADRAGRRDRQQMPVADAVLRDCSA